MQVSTGKTLIIAPHQDDETLGCGGLIALKRSQGASVQVVFLTDGSAASIPDPGMSRNDLVSLRRQEALAALETLDIAKNCVHFLDIPDASLNDAAHSLPGFKRLSSLLAEYRPAEIFVPHRHDCHPDHEAAWRIVETAVRGAGLQATLIQYPVWMLWSAPLFLRLSPRDLAGARRLSIRPVQNQKRRAIASYASQRATLPLGFLAQFLEPDEIFFFPSER